MSRSTFLTGPLFLWPYTALCGSAAGMHTGLIAGLAGSFTLAYWSIAWALFPHA